LRINAMTLVQTNSDELQRQLRLLRFNERRLRPALGGDPWSGDEQTLSLLEEEFLDARRREVAARAAQAPADPEGFLAWFVALRESGPGQHDPLFPWIEREASLEQLRWFLTQEVAGEAGFDDLVALTQVKMPTRCKLELARNYWDEMGRGGEAGMHGPMLARLADALGLDADAAPVAEALALANLLAGLALNRRYAYQSIGALGVIELTAPDRSRHVNRGLKRLRVPANQRQYFALHATLDLQHSLAWNREVIVPLVAETPACAAAIAEGALMRLHAGERCFQRYRRELGLQVSQ
jgi:hypothetical protein